MPEQVIPPERPDIAQNTIELKGFRGLCVKPDIANRPPNSWRRLDNFDLYIPGSIRKIAGPTKYSGPFAVAILAHAEYKATDSSPTVNYGVGTDGRLYDLSNPATSFDLGLGAISGPVFTCLQPGVLIPFTFTSWSKSQTVALNVVVSAVATDGQVYIFKCTTNGTTSSTHSPTWPTSGTIADGTVVWTNIGLQQDKSFYQNYLVVIVPGQKPVKFDGTNVTDVGVSAPTVPINLVRLVTTVDASAGLAIQTGRFYAWTWFNPKTLHESAPSPVSGSLKISAPKHTIVTPPQGVNTLPVAASDNSFNITTLNGPFLPPVSGQYYTQIGMSVPQTYLNNPPIGGSQYTHVRFYATKDGGSQLYLLQTVFSVAGDVLTDANGAVAISKLSTMQQYEAVPITQSKQTVCVGYDGCYTQGQDASQDSETTNNDLLTAGNLSYISLVTGTLTVDTDAAAHLNRAGGGAFFYTSLQIAGAQGTSWSLEIRIRTSDTIGGVIASYSDTKNAQTSTPANSDRYLWMDSSGLIHFAYRPTVGSGWIILSAAGAVNDGNNHAIDVVGAAGGVTLYIDGVSKATDTHANNPSFAGYFHFGWGDINLHPAITPAPGSLYYNGALDEIVWWQTTAISGANVANNNTQAGTNANYASVINALTPTSYWRLDDLSAANHLPTIDAELVFPSPALTDHFPPPTARWAAVFQGSLVVQDDTDANLLWPSDVGDFESYGEFQTLRIQNENDDDIVSLVSGLNLLVASTIRRVDGITGDSPATYSKQPIDGLHGFLGRRCVFPLGSKIIGLMRQGFVAFDLNMSFGATSGNIQLGYGDASLIGDDILPILQGIVNSALLTLVCIGIDNTQNIVLFAIKDANGVTYNDIVLMYTMGQTPGWSKLLPAVEYSTVRETLMPDGTLKIVADGSDKNVYELFQDYASSPLTAVAETQALPIPDQTGPEFWDVDRQFLYFYVEGQDLTNFTYSFAVDYPNNSTFVGPIPLQAGKNLLGGSGKQIVIRFSHSVAPTVSPPLISYVKIYFTLLGRRS